MKLLGVIICMSSLLMSSCAFIDGLKNNSDTKNAKQNKPVKTQTGRAAPLLSPNNNGTVEAAKTIAPITR